MIKVILTLALIHSAYANTGIKEATEFTIPEVGIALESNLTISKDAVHINGPILTNGHRLKIIANEITFGENGGIYGFYNWDTPPELEACSQAKAIPLQRSKHEDDKPRPYPTVAKAASENNDAHSGGPGKNGRQGLTGYQGKPGKLLTEPILLLASRIEGKIKIHAQGEVGGDGGQGGKGSDGQQGQKGGKGWASCTFLSIIGEDRKRSGNGGHGGAGGAGGHGGRAGLGGTNPEVFIVTTDNLKEDDHKIISLPGEAGASGEPGPHGKHGAGGNPGEPDHDADRIDGGFFTITTCEVSSGVGGHGGTYTQLEQLIGYPANYGEEVTKSCWNVRGKEKRVTKFSLSDNDSTEVIQKLKRVNIYKRLFNTSLATLKILGRFKSAVEMYVNRGRLPQNISKEIVNRLKVIWEKDFDTRLRNSEYRGIMVAESLRVSETMKEAFLFLEANQIDEAQGLIDSITAELKSGLLAQVQDTGKKCLEFKKKRGENFKEFEALKSTANKKKFVTCATEHSGDPSLEEQLKIFAENYQEKLPQKEDLLSISALPFCDNFSGINSTNPEILLAFTQKDIPLKINGKDLEVGEYKESHQCQVSSLNKSYMVNRSVASRDLLDFRMLDTVSGRKKVAKLYTSTGLISNGLKLTKLPGVKLDDIQIEDLQKELLLTAVMLGGYK